MVVKLTEDSFSDLSCELQIDLLTEKELESHVSKEILTNASFEAKSKQICLFLESAQMFVGVESLSADELRVTFAQVAKKLSSYKYKSVKIRAYSAILARAIVEGLVLGSYSYTRYKSKKDESVDMEIFLASEDKDGKKLPYSSLALQVDEALSLCDATNYTRDLVNTPPDDMTPEDLSLCAQELAADSSLECTIYDEKFLKDENMNAMLAVARASVHKPRLIHLHYKPKNAKKVITLVGKGLTYDSGGLSLKPSASMVTMKMDKAGGCTVLGILKAVEALKLPVEVHGFVGAVENMIGGNAYKPDDILVAKNGKTIEVRNTDAEGRLVLADVLCFAQERVKADYIFDFATLTGACVVALGQYTTGIMGHSGNLKHLVRKASSSVGELSASLPFNDHLKELLKSKIADMSNIGSSPYGGAITAALFLDHFIDEEMKQKWMHFDIAGSAYSESSWGVNPHGATGESLRTCVEFIKGL